MNRLFIICFFLFDLCMLQGICRNQQESTVKKKKKSEITVVGVA